MTRKIALTLAVLASGLIAPMLNADEPPRLGDGPTAADRPRVSSPYWNPTGPLGDLPAADIRTVPAARAAAVQAKWTYLQLQSDLNNATRFLVQQLERDPAYKQAVADEKAAWEAMESARAAALSPLQNNVAYQAAEALRESLTAQIMDERESDTPAGSRLNDMAKVKLAYGMDNRKLERDALTRDTTYQEARQRYIAAAKNTAELRDSNALVVQADANLQAMRKQIGDARIARLSTDAFLDSSIRARNIAIGYATYHRSYDLYHGTTASYPWQSNGYYPGGISIVGY